jgi:hypothetical protein
VTRERATSGALLALALAAGLALRLPGLALPHDRGDQLIWAGVARNVAERGREGYTLRGLAPSWTSLGGGAAIVSFECVAGKGPLLQQFMADGEKYWDAPLVNQPPGFFLVLLASHALLGRAGDGFPLAAHDPVAYSAAREEFRERNEAGYARRMAEIAALPASEQPAARDALEGPLYREQGEWERALARRLVARPPRGLVRAQLWATLPGLLADLATIALVFLGAHALGGRWAALLAGLAWASDPIALYCSERVLSNAPLATACALALALEALAAERKGARLSALVGLACAAAISIKVSAVFLLPAIVLGRLLRRDAKSDPRPFLRDLLVLAAVALAFSAPWWLLQWKVLGHPFGFAWRNQPDRVRVSPWGALVTGRGASYYVATLARSPLVVLGLAAGVFAGRKHATPLIFSVAVIAAAARFEEKEARHLLLAYPPLVVFGSVLVARAARREGLRRLVPALVLVVAAALVWQASAGLGLALDPAEAP